MKKQMMWMGVLLLTALAGQAQNIKPKNNTREKPVLKNERMQQPSASPYHGQESTVLNSTSSYPAFRRPADSFKIADPTIRALDANAKGANLKLGPSGLVGVPKGTYGFANGKIRLYPSGATSTGTQQEWDRQEQVAVPALLVLQDLLWGLMEKIPTPAQALTAQGFLFRGSLQSTLLKT